MYDLPVLNISEFDANSTSFYISRLSGHLKSHHIINHPHKHDFFLCVVFVKGKGEHEIDFKSYEVRPGSVFFLTPGQMHNWKLSSDSEGYIFFHTKEFYDLNYQNRRVKDFPFYASIYNTPVLNTSLKNLTEVTELLKILLDEFKLTMPMKGYKLASLTDLVYINLSRMYSPGKSDNRLNPGYLLKLQKLESLIDVHFKEKKSPTDYAELLNISGKHLNRIVKVSLNKTVSEMIADRIILEAKRMLVKKMYAVSQVADELGFYDHSYFNRFFKKHSGQTPLEFSGQSF